MLPGTEYEPGTLMREQINDAVKAAMKSRDGRRTTTLRLINAAIKDRDIEARGDGREKIDDAEILGLLQKMVKQREESIAMYQKGDRHELADQESGEIDIIKEFLPRPLSTSECESAIDAAIAATGAAGLRDMGKVVDALKGKYPGRIDFANASRVVKQKLGG